MLVARVTSIFVLLAGTGMLVMSAHAQPESPSVHSNMQGSKQRQMINCPSAVPGANSSIRDTLDGYELSVTAKGTNAIEQIRVRARSKHPVRDAGSPIEHAGEGTGGGEVGFCPLVHYEARVTVKDIEGGVRVHVQARDKSKVGELRARAKDRLEALSQRADVSQPRRGRGPALTTRSAG
jgi:hypothetical protein